LIEEISLLIKSLVYKNKIHKNMKIENVGNRDPQSGGLYHTDKELGILILALVLINAQTSWNGG